MFRAVLGFLALTFVFLPAEIWAQGGKKVAVLIGVKRYDNANFSHLYFTENDVVELGKLLRPAGFEVHLLADSQPSDRQPTRANVMKTMDTVLRRRKREDIVVFAFAGHGVQFEGDMKGSFFLPRDAEPNDSTSMISLKDVYDRLEDCGAGTKIMFVDACRTQVKKARSRSAFDDQTPAPPQGVCALFSCSRGQSAMELNDLKHGLFFYHVLEGLRGKAKDSDGEVTVLGLAQYAMKNVKRAGYNQSPVLKGEVTDGTLLGSGMKPTVAEAPKPAPPKEAKPRGLAFKYVGVTDASRAELKLMADAVAEIHKDGSEVRQIAIGPENDRIVVHGQHGTYYWNLSGEMIKDLNQVGKEGHFMNGVALGSNGSRVIIVGDHATWYNNIPDDMLRKLNELGASRKQVIRSINFGPNGSWVILHGNSASWSGNIPNTLKTRLEEMTAASRRIHALAFTKEGGWVFSHGTNAASFHSIPNQLLDELNRLGRENKAVRSFAFPPGGGYAILHDR